MPTETGKTRKTLAATTQQLLRIVQSIPSKKGEPFKLWLAEVGKRYIVYSLKREYASDNGTELNAMLPKMSPQPAVPDQKANRFSKSGRVCGEI